MGYLNELFVKRGVWIWKKALWAGLFLGIAKLAAQNLHGDWHVYMEDCY